MAMTKSTQPIHLQMGTLFETWATLLLVYLAIQEVKMEELFLLLGIIGLWVTIGAGCPVTILTVGSLRDTGRTQTFIFGKFIMKDGMRQAIHRVLFGQTASKWQKIEILPGGAFSRQNFHLEHLTVLLNPLSVKLPNF